MGGLLKKKKKNINKTKVIVLAWASQSCEMEM